LRVLLHILICVYPTLGVLAQTHLNTDSIPPVVLDLDEVVVEADNLASGMGCPVRIASLKVGELDRSSFPSRILALSKEPGVDMITMGAGVIKPVIRGLSGLRVTTLYRGARIESQAWGEDHGIYIPEEGVDRVEVIKGPSALAFGTNSIGGVINFLPDHPLQEEGRESRISLRGFSASSGMQASLITKTTSERAHHSFSGGYNSHENYLQPDGTEVENSGYGQFFAQGVFGYAVDWGLINGAYSSSYNTAGIIGSQEMQQSGDHLISTNATFIKMGMTWRPSVSYQLNHRTEFHEDDVDLDLSLRTLRYDVKGMSLEKGNWEIIVGSQGQRATNTNGELLTSEYIFIPDARCTEVGAYTISTWKREKLNVKAAVRGDLLGLDWGETHKSFTIGSYSLGVNYTLGKNTSLLASLSSSGRAPGLSELTANGVHLGAFRYELGDSELSPERSRNADLNFHHGTPQASIDISVFRNAIDDFIYFKELPTMIAGYNVYQYTATDALLQGGEVSISISPSDTPLAISSSVSYVDGVDLLSDESLPFMPPLTWSSELTYEKGAFATVSYDKTPQFQLVHLSAGLPLTDRIDCLVSVRNLLNTEYIPVLSLLRELQIPESGRNISVKLSLNF
jgi:iron complex outermembrane receptor protein